jgi:phage terminase small subunit
MKHERTKENLQGGGRKRGLTPKQQAFINELMVDENGTRAAAAAGYKHPAVVACFLQDGRKYPLVARAVQEARARKELIAERNSADVLRFIHTALFFAPADYFDPGGDGGWLISQEQYRNLPAVIKCLIEEMECRSVEYQDGSTVSTLWVRFVSKVAAMTLAAKHQLGENVNLNQNVINWDMLMKPLDRPVPDEVDEEIARRLDAGRAAKRPELTVNKNGCKPSRNGDGHT